MKPTNTETLRHGADFPESNAVGARNSFPDAREGALNNPAPRLARGWDRQYARPRRRPLQQFEIIDGDSDLGAERFELLSERPAFVVFFLTLDVALNSKYSIGTHRESAETTLPSESWNALTKPVTRRFLELADYIRERMRRTETSEEMQVVFDATNMDIGETEVTSGAGHVGVQVRTRRVIEERGSIPRRENDVNINK
ncbi:MAG TPA: hypothetical protein VN380_11090 [Thermoanaerobaculia bacterium]|nr:hypothetical protein [Thermoanaerobaculia bacterium]